MMPAKPKIKLRDGWSWKWWSGAERWAAVTAEGDQAFLDEFGDVETDGCVPIDVVLAVIQANAPEVMREHLAGLATPIGIDRDPERWAALHDPMLRAVYAWRDEQQRSTGAAPTSVPFCAMVDSLREFRSRVAADCYPEMAARIAKLERELEIERSVTDRACYAADEAMMERDQHYERMKELEREVEHLKVGVDKIAADPPGDDEGGTA